MYQSSDILEELGLVGRKQIEVFWSAQHPIWILLLLEWEHGDREPWWRCSETARQKDIYHPRWPFSLHVVQLLFAFGGLWCKGLNGYHLRGPSVCLVARLATWMLWHQIVHCIPNRRLPREDHRSWYDIAPRYRGCYKDWAAHPHNLCRGKQSS